MEIDINAISAFQIGNAQNDDAQTGVTVIVCERGATAGVDVSGGGPASRETTLVSPLTSEKKVHAVVLSGGSSFGLAASDGVMRYLEERRIGFDTGYARVPLVMQSCLYDLCVGSARVRPDGDMGYAACRNAEKRAAKSGAVGAGTGATVGKLLGLGRAMRSGLGTAALQVGALQLGAIVAVNALGDIFDFETGEKIAGLLTADRSALADTEKELLNLTAGANLFTGNTTLACIITNATLTGNEMAKVASQARNGFARAINPVGTTADGDSIYALSSGEVAANVDAVGTLAARAVAMAIRDALRASTAPEGLSSLEESAPV